MPTGRCPRLKARRLSMSALTNPSPKPAKQNAKPKACKNHDVEGERNGDCRIERLDRIEGEANNMLIGRSDPNQDERKGQQNAKAKQRLQADVLLSRVRFLRGAREGFFARYLPTKCNNSLVRCFTSFAVFSKGLFCDRAATYPTK